MKRGSTLFLKLTILLIAFVALVGLIRLPQTEGRAKNLDLISIYKDPFIIYIYIASIPFFIALYHAINLLRLVEKNKIFSKAAIKSVRNIKYSALAIIIFIVPAVVYLFMFQRSKDDIAGGVAVGLLISFISVIVSAAAAVLQNLLQNGVVIKSENDLTI